MIRRLFIVFIFLGLPSLCFGGFQCNNNATAHEGDTSSEVKLKCGPPMDLDQVGMVKIGGKYVNVERWTYNPGKGKFYQILEFRDGILYSIKTGPRV